MRMHIKILILVATLIGAGSGAGSASDKIRVGLYVADNNPPHSGGRQASEGLRHRLRQVFGFKHYELVKDDEVDLRQEWEQWFVPRRDFFIRVEPLHREKGGVRIVDYEIYKDGFIVAKGKYEPREGTPLFINGPDFYQGRLIFVLEPDEPKRERDT